MLSFMDFPLYAEIVDAYREKRNQGRGRDSALAELRSDYEAELADADDGAIARLALASVQCRRKELTPEVRDEALSAMERLEKSGVRISGVPALRKKLLSPEPYFLPPVERPPRKKPVYRCEWKLGDVYSHTFAGEQAARAGLTGARLLMRVAAFETFLGNYLPVVYLCVWTEPELPKTASELREAGVLQVITPRDFFTGDLLEYRIMLNISSKRDLSSFQTEYAGNFDIPSSPPNEAVLQKDILFISLKRLEDHAVFCHQSFGPTAI